MIWYWHGVGMGVLELPGPDRLELEPLVFYGPDVPTRGVWIWSQTGAVAVWAVVGQA